MDKKDFGELQKYIDRLIADLGLDNLPEDQKEEVVNRISTIAQNRILQTILLSAKEAEIEDLEKEIEEAITPEQIYQKLSSKIEGLDKKIEDSLSELYLNLKEAVNNKE
jgi:phosphotransacetylase